MSYKTSFFKFGGGGGGSTVTFSYTLREYSRTDTWTKPSNLIGIEVFIIGAGGGGASGAVQNSGVVSRAGGGGGGGIMKWGWIDASDLSATEPVVIGDGGVGGLPVDRPATTNNAGSNGGYTYFGIDSTTTNPFFDALGGQGATDSGSGGVGYGSYYGEPRFYPHQVQGPNGENSSVSGSAGSGINRQSIFSPLDYPNATSGGGVRSNNTPYDGGVGSELLNYLMSSSSPIAGGAAGGGDGADGANNVGTFLMAGPLMMERNLVGTYALGTTGGGGGGSATTNGGDAGVSGSFGAGGSGGGAARSGFNSGAGADGTSGIIKILEVTYTLV